jgi:hypothetical protein
MIHQCPCSDRLRAGALSGSLIHPYQAPLSLVTPSTLHLRKIPLVHL